ncbi:MAG: hypothetical protein CM15mP58_15950 [Burkholderiaceae bacterium]|nr:MAG: hypothetical protein CM15mP58_15950 [Burkholderiaceae bacterium]
MRRLSSARYVRGSNLSKVEKGSLLRGEEVEDPRLSVYWSRVSGESFNPKKILIPKSVRICIPTN